MDEPEITTCRLCDNRVLVSWCWRCSEHGGPDRWMCPRCAIAHEANWLDTAEACLWWRPVRESRGRWLQQAVFGSPHAP